jgi:hypothetical protein
MRAALALVGVLALVAGAEARSKQPTKGDFTLEMADKPDVEVRSLPTCRARLSTPVCV